MKNYPILVLTLICLLGAAACTPQKSYLEPSSMPSDLVGAAMVSTPSPVMRDGKDLIRIVAIDGRPARYLDNKVFVSPGKHTIQVSVELRKPSRDSEFNTLITRADTSLTFKAEANGSYLIDATEDSAGVVWIWATDLANNFVVAGDPPKKRATVQ